MVTKAQKIRLGIFVTVSLAILFILLIAIAGNQLLEKRDIYYISYEDTSVNGLQIGGTVRYNGIKVGRVDKITINPQNIQQVIVEISLEAKTPIKEDVIATLVPVGITGLKSVELSGGTNESKFLIAGSFITSGQSSFDNITGKAEVIAEKIELVLNNVIDLTNLKNREKIENIIASVDEILVSNKGEINSVMTNLDSITYNLASFSGEINNLMKQINFYANSDEVERILSNAATFSDSLSKIDVLKLAAAADQSIAQFNTLISNINLTVLRGRQDVLSSIETMREAIEYLNEFSRLISEDPSMLLRSRSREE